MRAEEVSREHERRRIRAIERLLKRTARRDEPSALRAALLESNAEADETRDGDAASSFVSLTSAEEELVAIEGEHARELERLRGEVVAAKAETAKSAARAEATAAVTEDDDAGAQDASALTEDEGADTEDTPAALATSSSARARLADPAGTATGRVITCGMKEPAPEVPTARRWATQAVPAARAREAVRAPATRGDALPAGSCAEP